MPTYGPHQRASSGWCACGVGALHQTNCASLRVARGARRVANGTLGWLAAAVFLDLLDAEVAALEPDAGRMGGWRRWACARPGRRRSSTSCWRPAAAGAAWPRTWTGWASSGRLVVIGLTGAES